MRYALKMILMFVMATALSEGESNTKGQVGRCQNPSARRGIDVVKARPALGIKYERTAIFKLASRQTRYRIGLHQNSEEANKRRTGTFTLAHSHHRKTQYFHNFPIDSPRPSA